MHRSHTIGKRRTVLGVLALFSFTRALAYIPGVRSTPIQEPLILAAGGHPGMMWVWIGLWAVAGCSCLWHFKKAEIMYPVTHVSTMCAAWGTAWLVGWILVPESDWWQTAITYWTPAIAYVTMMRLVPKDPRFFEEVLTDDR